MTGHTLVWPTKSLELSRADTMVLLVSLSTPSEVGEINAFKRTFPASATGRFSPLGSGPKPDIQRFA